MKIIKQVTLKKLSGLYNIITFEAKPQIATCN